MQSFITNALNIFNLSTNREARKSKQSIAWAKTVDVMEAMRDNDVNFKVKWNSNGLKNEAQQINVLSFDGK